MSDLSKPCPTSESLSVRVDALEKMLDEREARTKERFAAMDRNVSAALSDADKAVAKAEAATEKRFEGVNEFRQTLADQAARLMPRAEYAVQHEATQDKVADLLRRIGHLEDRAAGKKEASAGISSSVSLSVVVILALLTLGSAFVSVVVFLQHH